MAHTGPVSSVQFDPKGQYILSSGACIKTNTILYGFANIVEEESRISSTNTWFFDNAGRDRSIRVWDSETYRCCEDVSAHRMGANGSIFAVQWFQTDLAFAR